MMIRLYATNNRSMKEVDVVVVVVFVVTEAPGAVVLSVEN